MRHLVTGGAGFIGSALANRLYLEGHEVTVLDRMSRGKAERLHDGIRIWEADVRDRMAVLGPVGSADVIWHLAYVQGTQTFYADPKDVISVALLGVMNVLEAAESWQHKPDLFLVSSSEVYQNPPEYPTDESVPLSVPDVTNPRYSYGGGKIASELAALAYAQAGVLGRTVIVRPHNVYGPDMGWEHVIPEFAERLKSIPGGLFPIQGSGEETRSFCYIRDCIDGLMCLLERGEDRQVYHLGNPAEEYSIGYLAGLMADIVDMEIVLEPGLLPAGSPVRRAPDIGKMRELGFDPTTPLASGLRATLEWYMGHDRPEVPA